MNACGADVRVADARVALVADRDVCLSVVISQESVQISGNCKSPAERPAERARLLPIELFHS